MSKEVRNDPEVAQKLNQLDQAAKFYMAFDMQRMQADLNSDMNSQIARIRQDYTAHQKDLGNRLNECENLNKNSNSLKNESVAMRKQKAKHL